MMVLSSFSSCCFVFALSACGGSSGPALPITDGASVSSDAETITLITDALDVTLPLDTELDSGPFIGAAELDSDGNGYVLSFSETESTFAAFLVNKDEGTSVDSFYGRTAAFEELPSGQATLTGAYIGRFVNEEEIAIGGPIDGVATLEVDLDQLTISGGVTDMTIEFTILGDVIPFTLNDDLNVVFPEAAIDPDGTFGAIGEHTVTDEDTSQETVITTDFSGLLAGTSTTDLEVVGRVDTVAVTEGVNGFSSFVSTARQSGVFVVGHE